MLLPLLALLFLGASAAPRSPESAVAAARAAIDQAQFVRATAMIDEALRTFRGRDAEAMWTLRVMRVEAELGQGKRTAVDAILAEPPAKYRNSQANLRRLIYLGFAREESKWLDEAERLSRKHWPQLLGEVYRGRAIAFGDEAHARAAIRLARQHKQHVTEARSYATLALILGNARRYVEAVEAGERALSLTRLPNVAQNAEGNLGWLYYELGDYAMAKELLTKAEAVARKSGNAMNNAVWLIQLGNLRFKERDYAGARRYQEEASRVAPSARDRGHALGNLARIALTQGQFDQARELNRRALAAKREAKDDEAQLSSDIVEASILAEDGGDYAAAEKLLLDVVRETKLHGLDARTQLAKLYVRWKRNALAEKAFQQAVTVASEIRRGIKKDELQLPFFNTTDELLDAYVDFLIDLNRHDDALAVVEASRAQALEEGLGDAPLRVDPKNIARQSDATILSYWLGRKRSYLWVTTDTETTLHRLPEDVVVEREAEAYQRALLRPGPPPMDRGEALYKTLVAPAKVARGSRVIVVADGLLHTLNFETLVVPGVRHYWINDVIVTNAPSLQLLGRKSRPASASPSLLLVGDTPSPEQVSYPPLKYAAVEMHAIAKRFRNPTVLRGAEATPAAYRAASPGKFDYLHFVAHGVALPTRPLDSFIVLAPGGGSYKLLARDIEKVALKARLVTISSCEGAGKQTYAGEGIVGLAWAFLHAGADEVIASLWPVSDPTSARVMDDMYAGIRAGKDPAVALRDAKRALMRRSAITAKPFYWAPFVLYSGT